ncbi:MAG: hypothetical protein ACREUE_16045 [Panacagrimonas sp.]
MPPIPPSIIRQHGPWILRTLAVLGSAALSWYGLVWGAAGVVGTFMLLFGKDDSAPDWLLIPMVGMGYAWIAWIVLAVAWILQRRLHAWWPISGTVVGIVCIAWTLGFAIVFTFPAIAIAIVFVTFALSKEARQLEATRRGESAP